MYEQAILRPDSRFLGSSPSNDVSLYGMAPAGALLAYGLTAARQPGQDWTASWHNPPTSPEADHRPVAATETDHGLPTTGEMGAVPHFVTTLGTTFQHADQRTPLQEAGTAAPETHHGIDALAPTQTAMPLAYAQPAPVLHGASDVIAAPGGQALSLAAPALHVADPALAAASGLLAALPESHPLAGTVPALDHSVGGSDVSAVAGLLEPPLASNLMDAPVDDASRAVRVGVIGAILFFGVFLVIAVLAPMNGAAVANVQVSVSGDRLVIQPASSGLVSQILVTEGQPVRAGQPLVRLNGVRSGAELRQAQARRDVLRATEARLLAERDGAKVLEFPQDLVTRGGEPTVAAAIRPQGQLFQRHMAVLQADRSISDAQLATAEARRNASSRQLTLIRDELNMYRELYARGYARRPQVLALERNAAELEADSVGREASLQQAQLTRQRVTDSQLVDIVNQLAQVQNELAQINPQLDVARYQADLDLLRAPAAGRVAGVAQVGPGTVVPAGKTLMEIVPNGRTYIVEVRVKPSDVDDVFVGAPATVRFSTVNPHGRHSFPGHVVTLSPARIGEESGEGYYRAQVRIDDPSLLAKSHVQLRPGIPASVNITTTHRTLWNYITQPLADAFSGAMREE